MEHISRKITADHCRRVLGRQPPKGLRAELTRHGTAIWVYRAPGIYHQMKAPAGSVAFWQEFTDASRGASFEAPPAKGPTISRQDQNSLQWLIDKYLVWLDAGSSSQLTKKAHRNHLKGVAVKNGDKPFRAIDWSNVNAIRNQIAAHGFDPDKPNAKGAPAMANRVVSTIRAMYDWAIKEEKLIERNPCAEVTKVGYTKKSHTAWSDKQCDVFEANYKLGARAHLAYTLGLQTGQRCSDIVEMGDHCLDRDGDIVITQRKTKKEVTVPMTDELRAAIDACGAAGVLGKKTWICSEHDGSPISEGHFGNMIRAACDAIGIPECTAHGMRAAAATRALENGAGADELMAIFGFTLPVAAKYVATFKGKRAAKGGAHLLQRARKPKLKLAA